VVIQKVLWMPVQDFIQIRQKTQKMQEIFDLYSILKCVPFTVLICMQFMLTQQLFA